MGMFIRNEHRLHSSDLMTCLREMKSLDIFCASQAATAICMSLEQHVVSVSSSTTATIHLGSARHNPIIDGSRSSASSLQNLKPGGRLSISSKLEENYVSHEKKSSGVWKSSCIRPSAYFTPPATKRYLQSDSRELALVLTKDPKAGGKQMRASLLKNDTPLFVPTSDQVVSVSVSLHCKGCAGKVKKHISRMQGVTSLKVDFDARKVTVVGDVTRSEVIASISKVRTAQLLQPEKPNKSLEKPHSV